MARKPSAWKYVLGSIPDEGSLTFKPIRNRVNTHINLSESAIRTALRDLTLSGWLVRGGRERSTAWRLTAAGRRAKAEHTTTKATDDV